MVALGTACFPGLLPFWCVASLPGLPQRPWCFVRFSTAYAVQEQNKLFERLKACTTLPELQDIVHELGPYMSIAEVTCAFTTLKKVEPSAPEDFIRHLVAQAKVQVPMARPKHVAAIFHACSKLGHVDHQLFESLAEQAFLPFQIEAFNHGQVATTLHAFGSLQRMVQEQRGEQVRPRQHMNGASAGNDGVAGSHGLLFGKQDDLVTLLVGRFVTIGRDDEVNGWHVSSVVWGLSHLRFRHEELLNQLGRLIVLPFLREQYTSQGLATIVTGYGKFKYMDERVLDTLLEDAIRPDRIEEFTEQSLSGMLHALLLVGYRNDDVILPFLNEMMKPERLVRYSPWELSNLWEAMAEMRVGHRWMFDSLAEEMSKPERLIGLSNRAFHTVLSSKCTF